MAVSYDLYLLSYEIQNNCLRWLNLWLFLVEKQQPWSFQIWLDHNKARTFSKDVWVQILFTENQIPLFFQYMRIMRVLRFFFFMVPSSFSAQEPAPKVIIVIFYTMKVSAKRWWLVGPCKYYWMAIYKKWN